MDIERDLRAHLLERAGAPIPADLAGRLASRIRPRRPGLRWTLGRPLGLAAGGLAAVLLAAVLVARVAAPGPTASAPAAASASPASALPGATPEASLSQPVSSSAHLAHPMGAHDVILSLRWESHGGGVIIDSMRALRQDTRFVLYGDGTAIYGRSPSRSLLLPGAKQFDMLTSNLDPDQVDDVLRFALDRGRMRDASLAYPLPLIPSSDAILSVDAGGVTRELSLTDPGAYDPTLSPADMSIRKALDELVMYLQGFADSAVVRAAGGGSVYRADAYLAVLDGASQSGQPAFPAGLRLSAWPWPEVPPSAFHSGMTSARTAVVTPAEFDELAALRSFYASGVAVRGPDGKTYLISIRPLLRDEAPPP